ncbi:hypothetical protein EWI61_11600 [Methylolobus aquaticus]|nr:hypothetical protein EWI61_11600 [Methylolobus aquaticus]
MRQVPRDWLDSLTHFALLRGYGWVPRRKSGEQAREWQDPQSGLWYSQKKALEILKDQALALYDREGQPRRPYSLRC